MGDAALRDERTSLLDHYDQAPDLFDSLADPVMPHDQAEEQPRAATGGDPHGLVGQTVSHY